MKVIGEHSIATRIFDIDAALGFKKVACADKNGTIAICDGESVDFEFINGPGTGKDKFGYLSRIKYIGDTLFACGDLCQVYERKDGAWYAIDDGIRVRDKRSVGQGINDLDGFTQKEIYAIGDRGKIFCRHSNNWEIIHSNTNVSLEKVKCSKDDSVYIIGDKGTLLKGRNNVWDLCASLNDCIDRLWGLAIYRNEIYCCTALDLYKNVNNILEKVDIPIKQKGSNLKLMTGLDCLWLIQSNQLLSFDGSQWSSHLMDW